MAVQLSDPMINSLRGFIRYIGDQDTTSLFRYLPRGRVTNPNDNVKAESFCPRAGLFNALDAVRSERGDVPLIVELGGTGVAGW